MDESKENQITLFKELTNADEERARFFLESSGWNLTVAVSTFLDEDTHASAVSDQPAAAAQPRRAADVEDEDIPLSDTDEEFEPPKASKDQKKAKKSYDLRNAGGARIATLRQSDSSSDEENQAFYVGGGERSGQQVLGPPRKDRKKAGEVVEDLFKSAKEHGAEVVDPSTAKKDKTASFRGTGYRLGQNADDTEVIAGRPAPTNPKEVALKLWKNGFSVNDGPLRSYDDPANRLFLLAVKQGEIPEELVREAKGGRVHLDMEDHRDQDYEPTRSRFSAFTGQGHMLGSPAPTFSGAGATATTISSAPAPSLSVSDPKALEERAATALNLDSSQPTTNIQIRFSDGSRLVGKFNHSHTIQDVRRYVETARPALATAPFVLAGGVPCKEITSESSTLKDLGLLGSSLMLRSK